jgi:hypothetical protein
MNRYRARGNPAYILSAAVGRLGEPRDMSDGDSRIEVTLADPGKLLGVRDVEVLLDDKPVGSLRFGEKLALDCSSGSHSVQLALHAIVTRRSNRLTLDVAEGETKSVAASYTRLWGSIKITEAASAGKR